MAENRPRLREFLRRLWPRAGRRVGAPPRSLPLDPSTLTAALAAEGVDFDTWEAAREREPRLPAEFAIPAAADFRRCHPNEAAAAVDAAEEIIAHRFRLLGVDFVLMDPDRAAHADGYRPLDWYVDPSSGLRFPRHIPVDEWDPTRDRPASVDGEPFADIKLPWELARCQHWVPLAQAWRLTGEPRFAREIVNELLDFREAAPVSIGIHWTCTMDVAIRAVNWALALRLAGDAPDFDLELRSTAYHALYEHGVFIRSHLEDHYEVTSNHYLSNVVGLHFLGALFRDLAPGRGWSAFAREALETEMFVQILDDGADFESSVPYHRLVTELFLSSAHLARHEGTPLSPAFDARLRRMVEFLAAVLRPDGLLPQVGDADDGRLHIFTGYARTTPQDPRHIFGPAAHYFSEPAWIDLAGPTAATEPFWWGFPALSSPRPPDAVPSELAPSLSSAQHFPDAGLYVSRSPQHYLLVSHGPVGTRGFGNHKHDDLLSFELHLLGHPLIVDPGSHVYTGRPTSRNRFRSVAVHNTLRVNDLDQNEIRPEWLFRMFERAHPETIQVETTPNHFGYAGRHRGFAPGDTRLVHSRCFRMLRHAPVLLILDRVHGENDPREEDVATSAHLGVHFHFAPGVEARRRDERVIELTTAGETFCLHHPGRLAGIPAPGEYSPSYGVLNPTQTLDLVRPTDAPATEPLFFVIGPSAWRVDDDDFLLAQRRAMESVLRDTP